MTTSKSIETRLLLIFMVTTALAGIPAQARAACTMPDNPPGTPVPDAGPGDVVFNGPPHNVMQYCNGTDWIAMGGGGAGGMDSLTNGQIWIGDASNVATGRTLSGDATLSNAGALTISNDAITSEKIADGSIVGADIANATITTNKLSASGTANNTTYLRGDGQWAAPSFSYTETDPKVGAVDINKWCRGDGTQIVCDQDAPSGGGPGGPLTCAGGVNPQVHNDRCYTLFSNQIATWQDAMEHCGVWGGPGAGLVIINDAAENAFLTTNYGTGNAWIGATDNGFYGSWENNPRWWDTTTLSYTNWNVPNDGHNNRDYVYMTPTGTWRYAGNAAGSGSLHYICEAPNPYSTQYAAATCSNGLFHGQSIPPAAPTCGQRTLGSVCVVGTLATLGISIGPGCPPGGDADEADGDMMWLKALDPDIKQQIMINKKKGRL